jgi:hypothetical protein
MKVSVGWTWAVACTRLNTHQFQVNTCVPDLVRVYLAFDAGPQMHPPKTTGLPPSFSTNAGSFSLQRVSWIDATRGAWRPEADTRRPAKT